MNVRKRGLALLMCICMIFTLLPFSAFADGTSEPDVVYGKYDESGTTWKQVNGMTADGVPYENSATGANVKYSKTAVSKGNDVYDITLKIESETSSTAPGASAVVLVIDNSGSMGEGSQRLKNAKEVAKKFVDDYGNSGEERYIALVGFAKRAVAYDFGKGLTFNWDKFKWEYDTVYWLDASDPSNRAKIKNSIDRMRANGGTNLQDGLLTADDLLKEGTAKGIAKDNKFAIALTDGQPTYYTNDEDWVKGDGSSCDQETYNATKKAATTLKADLHYLYTVCYGAQDETIQYSGETVSAFLQNYIASSGMAYVASDGSESLKEAFEEIYESIEQGLSSGFTVTDPMGEFIQLDKSSIKDATAKVNGNTITWTPTTGDVSEEDGVKTYTYTLTYTVKLDTSADGFVDNKYYATNDVTTLAFKDGDDNITRDFNVPGVKGESPKCTVTYNKGNHGNLADQDTDGNVVYSSVKLGSATPKAPDVTPDNGYYFTGWEPTRAETVTEDVTYTAQYKIKDNLSYTVHYYWNGTNESVKADNVVTGQTFNTIVTEEPATVIGYTPVSDAAVELKIGTGTNEITFYYYKNVELVANSATYLFDNTAKTVSDYKAYSTEDTAKETELNITFNGVTATRTETQPGTYDVTFTGTTVGAKDTSDKYIVTKTTDGELTIDPAYQIIYEYKNTPENAPTCPVDNAYYADGTTVSTLQYPGTLEGYIFSGWKINGEGDAVNSVTFDGANIKLIGEWKPVEGLTCTINYWWMGDSEKPMTTKTVDNLTFGQPYSASPETFDGYTVENGDKQTITIKTTGNVIDFYYYKNVVLTADSDSATYNGNTHQVKTFKAIVAADRNADIAAQLDDYISALGEGKDAGEYDVLFYRDKEKEVIPVTAIIGRPLADIYYVTDAKTGTLTINPRTVIITSGSASKTYDGTPLTKHESTITGEGFVEGQGVNITYTGSQTEVGSSENTFEYKLKDNTLEKNYTIETVFGTLTVEKRPYRPNPSITDKITVEITGNSDSVVYDGTEHSVKDYTVKISDSRYTEKDFTFSGKALASGVNAGTYEMGLKADQFKNTNARFKNVEFIIKADGVLTITQRPLTITAGSAEGIAPVTCDKYTVEGLATGDKVDSVKITGIQSEPGESPNVASDAVIKNAKGEDVTANYKITYVNGVLKAIEVLNKEVHFNYVIGYTDGTIRPNNDISRAEVATIFFRLLTDEAREQYTTTAGNFTDVKAGMWCNRAIATLTNMGIIKGYTDGSFQPNKSITRAELATIIARFAKLDVNTKTFSDINGHWAQKNIELAAGNGWINGYEDGTFRPNNNITRAETFAMINRVLDRQTESVSDLLPTSEMNMWSDNMNENAWYYKDIQEATNYHKCDRVGDSVYEKWTEKVPDIDWASYQI